VTLLSLLSAVAVCWNPNTGGLSPYPHYGVALATFPLLFRAVLGIDLSVRERLLVTVTLVLHPLAVLYGVYRAVWWFDHLTHFLSAAVVAGIGLTVLLAVERERERTLTPRLLSVSTVVIVLVAGVGWEIYEFYEVRFLVTGVDDTLGDLLFDLLGGLFVVRYGRDYLDPLSARTAGHWRRLRALAPV
jgi:flagellar biosynthesis protein FliQ